MCRKAPLTAAEQEELERLQREMRLNSLGDRPHAMSADRLRRLIALQTR
jgi:hypothetical protein